jgi:hypothetical protein
MGGMMGELEPMGVEEALLDHRLGASPPRPLAVDTVSVATVAIPSHGIHTRPRAASPLGQRQRSACGQWLPFVTVCALPRTAACRAA